MNTILVYTGEDLLGDGILKLPFVYAVRHQFPNAHITWYAGQGRSIYATQLHPLIENYLDAVEDYPLIHSKEFKKSPLRTQAVDLIIDTQRDLGITWRLKRIPHKHFISRTWRGRLSTSPRRRSFYKGQHLVDQLIALLPLPPSLPFKVTIPSLYHEKWAMYFNPTHKYVGLAPGAGNTKKCWPLSSFIELARHYQEADIIPVFILGPQESGWKEELRDQVSGALFPLQDHPDTLASPLYTTGLGSYLKAAVANDAGVGHLLGLSPTHLISLFGPTAAQKLHPYTPRLTLIRAQDFGGNAMSQIPLKSVKEAIDSLL